MLIFNILRSFGIFYGRLVMLWLFGIFSPILVYCINKNLATLVIITNLIDFCWFSAKANGMILFLQNLAVFWVKNVIHFLKKKIFKSLHWSQKSVKKPWIRIVWLSIEFVICRISIKRQDSETGRNFVELKSNSLTWILFFGVLNA
jgi:hypothetical protein